MPFHNRSGFTLIELMVTIAVLAILAAIALPSFQSILEKRRLDGATESLFSILHLARSEAIKQNQNIQFQFDTDAWCVGIDDTGNDCDCADEPDDCSIEGITKVVSSNDFRDVLLQAQDFTDDEILISPRQGMPSDNGAFILTISGQSRNVSINTVGRVSLD